MRDTMRARSLEALLRPRSIALVGVSAQGGIGARILQSGQAPNFDRPVWPVNPNHPQIGGAKCYASLGDLPDVPDCVVVAVPADAVLGVLAEARDVGIAAAFVISEGFADAATDEGRERQRRLEGLARSADLAVAGPNCMGIASLHYRFAATMTDIPPSAVSGRISVVSQSGGLLNAITELARNRGIGLNYLVSSGNEAVVDMADYIDFLADDPATAVICCIMEGTRNGRRFRAAVERAARRKALVVLKLGRSELGRRATLAHTGTLAGRHEAFAALFRQNGVALVDSVNALVETAALLELAPLPLGDGLVMLTVSGGATSLIGDLGEAAGLRFPPLAAATNRRLREILGVERDFGNPVDTVGLPRLHKDGNLRAVIRALQEDDGVDVIGLVLGMRAEGWPAHRDLIESMADAAGSSRKPLLIVSFMSGSLTGHWRGFSRTRGLPLVEDLKGGLQAVRHLVDYAAFRRRADDGYRGAKTARSCSGRLAPLVGRVLTEAESKSVLGAAGLPVTREALARDPTEAVRMAGEIGGAVALKIQSKDIPHKSDVGGVRLGARTPSEVAAAARQVLENAARHCPRAVIDGVLVQEMVEDGAEFVIGMTYDDQFGPLVVCGAGGVMVEVIKDAAVLLPPVAPADVVAALRSLKAATLLDGFRGAAPRDAEALVDCCVRFSDFVVATDGQFAAIDLNPVFVCARGRGVRIADALIEVKADEEAGRD